MALWSTFGCKVMAYMGGGSVGESLEIFWEQGR